jgi:phosphotriesterase-related protein
MSIVTVLGPVSSDKLRKILPHEHLLIDLTNQYRPFAEASKASYSTQKVNLQNRGILARNPLAMRDNLLIDDVDCAQRELMEFKKAGGDLIADVTSIGLGRDPVALRAMSRAVGVGIVAGCGYYYHATHPDDMDRRSVGELAEEMIRDIREGIDGTDIRAGVIGEIGISPEMHANEKKILAAAARAQQDTGMGLQVHIFPWAATGRPLGMDAIDVLGKNGADMCKVSINHVDVAIGIDLDYILDIVKAGAYAEFDNFGHEFYVDKPGRKFIPGPFATDVQRTETICEVIARGYIDRILVSSDICHKSLLHEYGGWGYDHVLTNIIPMFGDYGLDAEKIKRLTEDNPRAFLDSKRI